MNGSLVRDGVRNLIPYLFLPVAFPNHLIRPAVRILMYHRVARLPAYDQLTVTPDASREHRGAEVALARRHAGAGGDGAGTRRAVWADGGRGRSMTATATTSSTRCRCCVATMSRPQSRHRRLQRRLPPAPALPGRTRAPAPGLGRDRRRWPRAGDLNRLAHVDHRFLTRLDDKAAERRYAGSRREIAERIGADVESSVIGAGDVTARERPWPPPPATAPPCACCPGGNRDARERFTLRRTEVTDRDGGRELLFKL